MWQKGGGNTEWNLKGLQHTKIPLCAVLLGWPCAMKNIFQSTKLLWGFISNGSNFPLPSVSTFTLPTGFSSY